MATDPESPPSSEARSRKPTQKLHEPFVSPEFGGRLPTRSSRLLDDDERGGGGMTPQRVSNGSDTASFSRGQVAQLPQAAPLYTVSAAGAADGLLINPSPAASDALLHGKGPLVVEQTSAQNAAMVRFKHKFDRPSPTQEQANQAQAQKMSLSSPRDMSPLVTEATCTWGQELETVLGQAVGDPISAKSRVGMPRVGPTLTTTGLFPQIMTLRFSSPIRVTSVHLRVRSVLRLNVDAGEGFLGWKNGKTVDVPAAGPCEEQMAQDVEVDVRDIPRFQNTRSISIAITAGSQNFCNLYRLYAMGVQL